MGLHEAVHPSACHCPWADTRPSVPLDPHPLGITYWIDSGTVTKGPHSTVGPILCPPYMGPPYTLPPQKGAPIPTPCGPSQQCQLEPIRPILQHGSEPHSHTTKALHKAIDLTPWLYHRGQYKTIGTAARSGYLGPHYHGNPRISKKEKCW